MNVIRNISRYHFKYYIVKVHESSRSIGKIKIQPKTNNNHNNF